MELIIAISASILSSSLLTTIIVAWAGRRKSRAEASKMQAEAGNAEMTRAKVLIDMAVTQMHEERTFFELRIGLLEKRNEFLETRVSYLEQELAKARG